MKQTVFLFGESEKGEFGTPILCHSLAQLADTIGIAPIESHGIQYAVQTLLFQKDLIFFRVKEEGYSFSDYMKGVRWIESKEPLSINAVCLPGVGDAEIIHAVGQVCLLRKSLLVLSEKDLYDYLTCFPQQSPPSASY